MAELRARFFEGAKFIWDGREYESDAEAQKVKREYEKENFETQVVEEDGKFHVYTRRVVTDVEVDGAPPV